MDHVVCLNSDAHELENLVNGSKSMIIRGDNMLNPSFGSVKDGDTLYFINDFVEGKVLGRGLISHVFISGRLSEEESYETIIRNQDRLQLPDDQFYSLAGKSYLVLIGLSSVVELKSFCIDTARLTSGNGWFTVGSISMVAVNHCL